MNSKEWRDWIDGAESNGTLGLAPMREMLTDLEAAARRAKALEAGRNKNREWALAAEAEVRRLMQEHVEQAVKRDALQGECRRLRWFILAHKPKSGYDLDHACAECVPGGEMIQQGWRCGFHLALAPQAREQTPPEAQKGPLGIPIEASDSLAPDEVRFVDHTGIKARIVNLAEPPEAQGREEA